MGAAAMNRFVLMLTVLLLAQMAYAAIDNALSPYEPAIWFWSGSGVASPRWYLLLGSWGGR
jgi:hypothetical protein